MPATRTNPASVDAGWQRLLRQPQGRSARRRKNAEAARPGQRPTGRCHANGELVAALDGNWGRSNGRSAKKIKAKAARQRRRDLRRPTCAGDARFRARHHDDPRLPHARPSARRSRSARPCKPQRDHKELRPETYGFTEADYDRPIFIDKVLGLEFATVREMLEILRRTYCSTLGVEFMHISDPAEKAWIQERIEGPDKDITFTAEGKRAILSKLIEAEGFEKFIDVKYTGTKRFGLDGARVADPGARADHQARRPARREGDRARHGASRPAQRAGPGDGQAAPRHLPRVQGRLVHARRRRGLGRREVPSRRLVGPRVRRQQGAPVADRQPVASGDRRSGGAGQGARQAGPADGRTRRIVPLESAPRCCRC